MLVSSSAMFVIVALWLAELGVVVTSSNVAWQENVRPKMYVQLGRYSLTFPFTLYRVLFLRECGLRRYCHLADISFAVIVAVSPVTAATVSLFHYLRKRIKVDINRGTCEFCT